MDQSETPPWIALGHKTVKRAKQSCPFATVTDATNWPTFCNLYILTDPNTFYEYWNRNADGTTPFSSAIQFRPNKTAESFSTYD
jgi:hypothetical protein